MIATLVAGSLFAGSLVLQAQNTTNKPPAAAPPAPRGGARGGGQTLDQLTTALNLTDDQKPKVKSILDTRDQKMRDLRDSNPTPEERRTKMQSIRQETTDGLKKVLTNEQFTKYQQMTPGGARNRGRGPAGNPPANPPQQ